MKKEVLFSETPEFSNAIHYYFKQSLAILQPDLRFGNIEKENLEKLEYFKFLEVENFLVSFVDGILTIFTKYGQFEACYSIAAASIYDVYKNFKRVLLKDVNFYQIEIPLDEVEGELVATITDLKQFAKISKFCKKDELVPNLECVCIGNNEITATDKYKLIIYDFDYSGDNILITPEGQNFINKQKTSVDIYKSEKTLSFVSTNESMTIEIKRKSYPNYKQIIPENFKYICKLDAAATKQLKKLAANPLEKNGILEINFEKNTIVIEQKQKWVEIDEVLETIQHERFNKKKDILFANHNIKGNIVLKPADLVQILQGAPDAEIKINTNLSIISINNIYLMPCTNDNNKAIEAVEPIETVEPIVEPIRHLPAIINKAEIIEKTPTKAKKTRKPRTKTKEKSMLPVIVQTPSTRIMLKNRAEKVQRDKYRIDNKLQRPKKSKSFNFNKTINKYKKDIFYIAAMLLMYISFSNANEAQITTNHTKETAKSEVRVFNIKEVGMQSNQLKEIVIVSTQPEMKSNAVNKAQISIKQASKLECSDNNTSEIIVSIYEAQMFSGPELNEVQNTQSEIIHLDIAYNYPNMIFY